MADAGQGEAYGRYKPRFKPGDTIFAFHKTTQIEIRDISDSGFKLANPTQAFVQGEQYLFDLIFKDHDDVAGWRVTAQCRWATEAEAGFMFTAGKVGQAISRRIAGQHLRGRLKVLNGVEI